jgi:hypothetical protein
MKEKSYEELMGMKDELFKRGFGIRKDVFKKMVEEYQKHEEKKRKRGKEHDFALFKKTNLKINPEIKLYADTGYLEINKIHSNSEIPHKNSKNHKLTKEEKRENRELSKKRIIIENVNAEIKVFKILGGKYRNKRKK